MRLPSNRIGDNCFLHCIMNTLHWNRIRERARLKSVRLPFNILYCSILYCITSGESVSMYCNILYSDYGFKFGNADEATTTKENKWTNKILIMYQLQQWLSVIIDKWCYLNKTLLWNTLLLQQTTIDKSLLLVKRFN